MIYSQFSVKLHSWRIFWIFFEFIVWVFSGAWCLIGPPLLMTLWWDCSLPRYMGNWEIWKDEPLCRWGTAQYGDALAILSKIFQGYVVWIHVLKRSLSFCWSIKHLCKRRTKRENRDIRFSLLFASQFALDLVCMSSRLSCWWLQKISKEDTHVTCATSMLLDMGKS